MTSRERFLRTMRYGRPDRVPYLEEGLRDDVLQRWRAEGLPADADLAAMFHTDRREQIELVLEPLAAVAGPADLAARPENAARAAESGGPGAASRKTGPRASRPGRPGSISSNFAFPTASSFPWERARGRGSRR